MGRTLEHVSSNTSPNSTLWDSSHSPNVPWMMPAAHGKIRQSRRILVLLWSQIRPEPLKGEDVVLDGKDLGEVLYP